MGSQWKLAIGGTLLPSGAGMRCAMDYEWEVGGKVFPCGGAIWGEVLHECQLCLWEAFHLFLCLYRKMFRMREAYNGTHKGMDEVYLGVCIHVYV